MTFHALAQRLLEPLTELTWTTYLEHGGTHLTDCRIQAGHVIEAPEDGWKSLCKAVLSQGPEWASTRGTHLPLEPHWQPVVAQLYAEHEEDEERRERMRSRPHAGLLSRAREGEDLGHRDRFTLLMSLLRADWSDEDIHREYANMPHYDADKTTYFLRHAKATYL